MSWRPWVILGLLFVAFISNAVLIFHEKVPTAEVVQEVGRVHEILRHIQYLPSSRRNNFKDMGFDDDQADACAK